MNQSGSCWMCDHQFLQNDINCNCKDGTCSAALKIPRGVGHCNVVWLLLKYPEEVRRCGRALNAQHLNTKQQVSLTTSKRPSLEAKSRGFSPLRNACCIIAVLAV